MKWADQKKWIYSISSRGLSKPCFEAAEALDSLSIVLYNGALYVNCLVWDIDIGFYGLTFKQYIGTIWAKRTIRWSDILSIHTDNIILLSTSSYQYEQFETR